jgi:hypothetical protein
MNSDVLAAKILGHVGDVCRFGSAVATARSTTPPPRGVQAIHPGSGRDHHDRKLVEHRSFREALRSLKRQLAKVVYRPSRRRSRPSSHSRFSTPPQLAELVQLLVERVQTTGRTVEPKSIEWTPPARPFFEEGALLKRPRTDSNPQQQRSVLDWYLEVG